MSHKEICPECTGAGRGLHIDYCKVCGGTGEVESVNWKSRAEYEEIIAQLIQVKGIGRWTAEMFLIFCLGRLDVLPVTDLGIRKAMQKIYALPALPKPSEMLAISQPWRPYRSVATWYLWKSVSKFNSIG